MKMLRPSRVGPSCAGLLAALALAGCQLLSHDGPSTQSASREAAQTIAANQAQPTGQYALVDLTYGVTEAISAHPAAALTGLVNDSSAAPNDRIQSGDQLSVSVFEAGTSGLFANAVAQASQGAAANPLASSSLPSTPTGAGSAATLPALIVNSNGDLLVPFAGTLHVAGLRSEEAAAVIRRALKGRAIEPQVTVTVVASHANSVSVLGEVRLPGRFLLAAHNERLLDLLAMVGGPAKPAPDLMLAVDRGVQRAEAPLSLVMDDPTQNIRLAPEDRVLLLDRPRTYSTFGGLAQPNNAQPMLDNKITLADAISKGGGLDTLSANAASVLLFRFERPEVAQALGVTLPPAAKGVPIVYRLNFRKPEGLFVAHNFEIEPEDLLYVPRADIYEAAKFFNLVNSVTQIGYNARVTTSSAVP